MAPTSAKSITWLHLSDVHLCKPRTGWDVHRVLRPLLADLRRMQSEHGLCPDLIFFSGDLAFGNIGTGPDESIAEQFDDGHQWLESVRQAFVPAVPQQNVFVVPGNHDVNRRECPVSVTSWLDGIDNVNKITGLIQTTPLDWKHIMLRLADYAGFLTRHGYQHLLGDPERLIYSQIREISGVTIGIAGLNSAWSCSRDNEKGKLWMGGDWQIGQLTSQLQDVDFRIAVVHHPGNWFRENEDPHIWQLIERDFQFCLHGHEHQGWVRHLADGHTRISAAAGYQGSVQENEYNFVRIGFETGTGEVWLRRYDSAGGGWVPRNVANKTDDAGRWKLTQLSWLKTLGAQVAGNDPAVTQPAAPPPPVNAGRVRPAMGGDSISHVRGTAGTLGCLVCDRKEPQRVYVLSDFNGLCHPTDESFEGDAIVQPGRADGGTRATDLVAMLTRWTRVRDAASAADGNVSAAIGEVRRREEFSAEIRGRGLLKGVRPAVEGMEVWVVARSGQASGKVIQIGAKQKIPVSHQIIEGGTQSTGDSAGFHPILFGDLIVCTTMLQPGDCGAILVDRQNYAVGLGFVEVDDESYFFPIQRVLDALDVELMTEWPPVPPGPAAALTPAVHTPSASQRPPKRDIVYISYSHRDKQWHDKLREVLDKDDRLPVWDDTKIPAGADFEREIREHVSRARIMIMLVSPDYVSPNCGAAELEIKPALEAAKKGDINILWIPVRASAVFEHPIGKLLAAHDPARPLEALDPAAQQKALASVCERIYGVLGLSSRQSYQYDAFVSYRHQEPDKAFAWKLARDLEAAGYSIALDARDFSPQATFLEEMERCIKQSRFTLAVSSPRYFQSGNTNEEAIITKVLDMDERRRRLIPLKIEVTEMPVWMYNIVGIDFTEQQPFVDPIHRLKQALRNPQ